VRRAASLALAACLAGGCGGEGPAASAGGEQSVAVAAAADLRPAFTRLARDHERRTGDRIVLSFGSSGQLAQQIVNGAPFDLFASASVDYVDQVLDAGRGDPGTKSTYAFGLLVVWSRDREYDLEDLAGRDVRRVAIANPEHAPYGRAARQALERAGILAAVQPKLVLGENVSDTQRLAASGNADAAIVALSLAIGGPAGRWTRVPERLHDPLEQALVVTGDGGGAAAARRFARTLAGREGREVMRRAGFVLPGDRSAAAGGRSGEGAGARSGEGADARSGWTTGDR
jgi:molybdate transport system substrate-binding protein